MLCAIYSNPATYSKKVVEMSVCDTRFDHFDAVFVHCFTRRETLAVELTDFVDANALSFDDGVVFNRPNNSSIAMAQWTYHVLSSV